MKRWVWIGAGGAVLLITAVVWMFLVNTVRIPEEGDRFVYEDSSGRPYTFSVTRKDPATRTLTMKGEGAGEFYDLLLTFSYDGRWLEWTHVEAKGRGESVTCDLKRGGRGFLLFPVKRLLSRPGEFGFRAVCVEEGAFTYQAKLAYGGGGQVDSKAPALPGFRIFKIGHVVSYPLQQDTLGTLDFSVAPRIGFPARFTVTLHEEGGYGRGGSSVYTFDLVQFIPVRPG